MCSFRAFRPVALRGHLSVALPLGIIEPLSGIEVNRPNGYCPNGYLAHQFPLQGTASSLPHDCSVDLTLRTDTAD